MLKNLMLIVESGDAGLRSDQFIVHRVPTTERALVRLAFAERKVLLNEKPCTKGTKLRSGDVIFIEQLYETTDRYVIPALDFPLHVIFEDTDLLVFNKPAGMPVHPLRIGETGTLANAMVARYPETARIGPDRMFPALVHRIDTDTSGLVIAARTHSAYDNLREQFRRHTVIKEYWALVHGLPPREGKHVHHLAHDPKRPGHMLAFPSQRVSSGLRSMKAAMDYRVVHTFGAVALVNVCIRTGVTHQVRCQLAALGHPIIGDSTYGHPEDRARWGIHRHFLHAAAITFSHPATGKTVRFEAPPPSEWNDMLSRLEKQAR